MAANTAARRKIPRGVDAALVVVVVGGGGGGGGGEAAAMRLLGEFLTGDLRMLRIGPRAAKSGGVHPKVDGNDGGDRDGPRWRRWW